MDGEDLIKVEYELIAAELKEGKTQFGRKWKVTSEMYKRFVYFYLQTTMRDWSARKSGIGVDAYNRMRAGSQTFRNVLERDGYDLKAQAMIVISKAIRGVPATLDKNGAVITPGIAGNPRDAWQYVQLLADEKKKEEEGDEETPKLGVPKTEKEVELMASMLDLYAELRRKRAAKGRESDPRGSDISQR